MPEVHSWGEARTLPGSCLQQQTLSLAVEAVVEVGVGGSRRKGEVAKAGAKTEGLEGLKHSLM